MSTEPNLSAITDKAIKDISKKVARMEMHDTETTLADSIGMESCSLVTTAKGDYELTIVFCAGVRVMRAIAENMKRGELVDEEDIAVYTKEFFNILCGHVVSALNRVIHASARFGIPLFLRGCYHDDEHGAQQTLCELRYQCHYGPVKIRTIFHNMSS